MTSRILLELLNTKKMISSFVVAASVVVAGIAGTSASAASVKIGTFTSAQVGIPVSVTACKVTTSTTVGMGTWVTTTAPSAVKYKTIDHSRFDTKGNFKSGITYNPSFKNVAAFTHIAAGPRLVGPTGSTFAVSFINPKTGSAAGKTLVVDSAYRKSSSNTYLVEPKKLPNC